MAQLGSASALGAEGRQFESDYSDQAAVALSVGATGFSLRVRRRFDSGLRYKATPDTTGDTMQTFLVPLTSLDDRRLGKQRVEAKQIYMALTGESSAWRNHPATIMWEGCEPALAEYGLRVCSEWLSRGYDDSVADWFSDRLRSTENVTSPWWMTDSEVRYALLLSHASNLLRKNSDHYLELGRSLSDTEEPLTSHLPYLWPRSDGNLYLSVAESRRLSTETREAMEEFGWRYTTHNRQILV